MSEPEDEGVAAGPRPRIGITTYGRDEEGSFELPAEYVESVRRAGGVPVLLPPGELHLEELLEGLDGLVLAGGGDVDPKHYGAEPHSAVERVDAERDTFELALVRELVAQRLPALGICRGCQVVNVALGGTLHRHLPDVVGDALAHTAPEGEPRPRHPVEIEPGSRLARLMGQTRPEPVSWHHQAPDRVAPGLRVVARAEDGTVEAVELPAHPWLLAVQWHPELSASDEEGQQSLFDGLVAAARQRGRSRAASRAGRVEGPRGGHRDASPEEGP